MQFTSSTDLRYTEKVNQMKRHFGDKSFVTRQDVLDYAEKTGNNIPVKFWSAARVGRGMFDLNRGEVATKPQVTETHPTVVEPVVAVAEPIVASRFSYESQIPQKKDTFVEWGHFRDVKKLIASNEFFTLYVTGESGTGKNEMIEQACAVTGRAVVRVNMTNDTKEDQLLGSKTLVNGNIVWEDGPVTWCAEQGAILLIDEISLSDANTIMCIQNVMEGKPFFVKGANKLVTPQKGFAVICTDNTKGRGSDSGRYIGTNILNDAFLERFEMTMVQQYPTEKVEREILSKLMVQTGMDNEEFLNKLIKWVHAIRRTYMEEGIEEHITTRRACHIVNVFRKIGNERKAIELCVNRFDETSMQAMLSLWDKLEVAVDVPAAEATCD